MEKVTIENWKEYLEESPDVHDADCCANSEHGCDTHIKQLECCNNAKFLKMFIEKVIHERDRYWAKCIIEHRKNSSKSPHLKSNTDVKRLIWGNKSTKTP